MGDYLTHGKIFSERQSRLLKGGSYTKALVDVVEDLWSELSKNIIIMYIINNMITDKQITHTVSFFLPGL